MRSTLSKLRVAVVVLALLLVGGVAGVVIYGRHLAHNWAVSLPKRLAKGLLQESFNVSYSHSEHGKTVFTVHAAKEQKWTSGLITLDDVGIELYGRQDGAADRIQGSKFEFDQAKGELRAVGEVYIDLAAPPGKRPTNAAKTLHVKTSGLVFNQKARTAATGEAIEFEAAGMKGTAIGADYDSVRQFVVLRSNVRLSGARNGRSEVLTAAHAEIDRKANVADLREAKYVSLGESAAADHARVLLTAAGGARGIEAEGHVLLTGVGRGALSGQKMQVDLNQEGKVKEGHLWGGVRYLEKANGKDEHGQADDLRVQFGPGGAAEHAVMSGAVQMEARTHDGSRSMQAQHVDVALAELKKGQIAVRKAAATGGAVLRMATNGAKGRSSDEVRGDELRAAFTGAGASARVTHLDGVGHTSVQQMGVDGVEERSTGDSLQVEFSGAGRGTGIAHAVQGGGFRMERSTPARPGGKGPVVERGQASQATFDGTTDRMMMTGAAQLTEGVDLLQADTVTLEQGSGDAEANGNVKVSYAQADGKGEPVHVVAARAVEHRAQGTAEFFGGGTSTGSDARMWQGGSQVSAPVLQFDRAKKTMVAHGQISTGDADAVRTVLLGSAPPKPGAKEAGPVRVLSHSMTYSDAMRQVTFSGRVRVEDRDGVLTAREATAYLAPVAGPHAEAAEAGFNTSATALPTGQVERIVAKGSVLLEQTERRAQGEELVYTAVDKSFVLTGTPAARPTMTDDAQGTITGTALRFRTGENSVQVTGGEGQAGRVRSDLRVRQR